MSNRFSPKFAPIRYDPEGIFVGGRSWTEQIALGPALEEARRGMLADSSNCVDSPARKLAEQQASRTASELGRIVATGRRLRESVDRLVVLDVHKLTVMAQGMIATCCHPFHNELERGDRGGRPRVYFGQSHGDNDATQGLLDLLGHGIVSHSFDDRWALILVEHAMHDPPAEAVERILLAALCESCRGDAAELARRLVLIGGPDDEHLPLMARSIDGAERFAVPDGLQREFSVGWAATLLPAAVLGLDVVRFLEGAAAMSERFRAEPVGNNPALDFAGASQLFGSRKCGTRLVFHDSAAASLARWYTNLRTCLLVSGQRPPPADVLPFVAHVFSDTVRRDRLPIPALDEGGGGPGHPAGELLTDLFSAEWRKSIVQLRRAGWPVALIHLPAMDESALGQLFQMLLVATLVEWRLPDHASL